MNKEHYNQIIDWTVQQEQLEDKRNTLEAARLIFKNMGIPLPNGTMEEAATVLATNDYMGWRKCTAKEAQTCANDGTAAMAVKGNEIYIVKAESDGKDEVATVHSADDTASTLAGQEDAQFYSYSAATTTVEPMPTLFTFLEERGIISRLDIQKTTDGFQILTCSLASILQEAGITKLYDSTNTSYPVETFYDDWYIYTLDIGSRFVYGLYKMREYESDSGDKEGITISFIDFEYIALEACVEYPDNMTVNRTLYDEINRVTKQEGQKHDLHLQRYFSNPTSKGSYLIVQTYIDYIASAAKGGYIPAPKTYTRLMNQIADLKQQIQALSIYDTERAKLSQKLTRYMRIPDALKQLNQKAGYSIFETSKDSSGKDIYRIKVKNSSNLTYYETYAILMPYTANENMNSFAAEVLYHADALTKWYGQVPALYERAIRADMILDEDGYRVSGFGDEYYDLNSSIVKEQANIHGAC